VTHCDRCGLDYSGSLADHHLDTLDTRATPTPATLDDAWAAAEAELPDGWIILSLSFDAGRWGAAAYDASFTGRPWHQRYRRASGDTPAAALLALAGVFQAER